MAKTKRGYFVKSFTFEGKKYFVYAKDKRELLQKTLDKQKELEEHKEQYFNPSLRAYYEHFTELRRREVKESTLRAQISQFNNMASVTLPSGQSFGELKLKEVTRRDIEEARCILLEAGKSPESLNICFAHLNHVFNSAMLEEVIIKNPCKALRPLKRESEPITSNRHRALSLEETKQFLEASEERGSYYHNAFLLMLSTGLRIGELGALYLTDTDSSYIKVRRTITRDENGLYKVGDDAKTASGVRDIPQTEKTRSILRDQRQLNNIVFGLDWSGVLFKGTEGTILRESTVNREIKQICKLAGIEPFTCHAFRVTFATRFIEQRPQDYKALSEILGHKDISITLNLYTRVMQETKVQAMQALDFGII